MVVEKALDQTRIFWEDGNRHPPAAPLTFNTIVEYDEPVKPINYFAVMGMLRTVEKSIIPIIPKSRLCRSSTLQNQ